MSLFGDPVLESLRARISALETEKAWHTQLLERFVVGDPKNEIAELRRQLENMHESQKALRTEHDRTREAFGGLKRDYLLASMEVRRLKSELEATKAPGINRGNFVPKARTFMAMKPTELPTDVNEDPYNGTKTVQQFSFDNRVLRAKLAWYRKMLGDFISDRKVQHHPNWAANELFYLEVAQKFSKYMQILQQLTSSMATRVSLVANHHLLDTTVLGRLYNELVVAAVEADGAAELLLYKADQRAGTLKFSDNLANIRVLLSQVCDHLTNPNELLLNKEAFPPVDFTSPK